MTRRRYVTKLMTDWIFVWLGRLYRFFHKAENIEVTEKVVPVSYLCQQLRVLHMSDLHASKNVSYDYLDRAISVALEQNADIAILTGDFITDKLRDAERYQKVLSRLSREIPTFACVGNHDGGRWIGRGYGYKDHQKIAELLAASKIELLFNQTKTIELAGNRLKIIGLGDRYSDDDRHEEVLQDQRDEEIPHLVLAHNPDTKEKLLGLDWDLMLSGHTHGGQFVVPFFDYRPVLPVRDRSFPDGLRNYGKKTVHITRGVGNLHGLRFNCRPEISLLDLVPVDG